MLDPTKHPTRTSWHCPSPPSVSLPMISCLPATSDIIQPRSSDTHRDLCSHVPRCQRRRSCRAGWPSAPDHRPRSPDAGAQARDQVRRPWPPDQPVDGAPALGLASAGGAKGGTRVRVRPAARTRCPMLVWMPDVLKAGVLVHSTVRGASSALFTGMDDTWAAQYGSHAKAQTCTAGA
eukprot:365228-Chlamydomonas_euryale.AAC.44